MKLKSLVAALAVGFAASANAAIDNGAGTDDAGELFFNLWDANGSYTRDLNISIASFESQLAAGTALQLSFSADSLLTSFFAGTSAAGARSGTLLWNVVASDSIGSGNQSRSLVTTYTEGAGPFPPASSNPNSTLTTGNSGTLRSANVAAANFAIAVNGVIGSNNSVAVNSSSPAFAGKAGFGGTFGGNFAGSNAGTVANNSYLTGLSFERIKGAATGTSATGTTGLFYSQYLDTTGTSLAGQEVHAYFTGSNALVIEALPAVAAIPEPETYAMLLAGLGMIGFMARRRLNVN